MIVAGSEVGRWSRRSKLLRVHTSPSTAVPVPQRHAVGQLGPLAFGSCIVGNHKKDVVVAVRSRVFPRARAEEIHAFRRARFDQALHHFRQFRIGNRGFLQERISPSRRFDDATVGS